MRRVDDEDGDGERYNPAGCMWKRFIYALDYHHWHYNNVRKKLMHRLINDGRRHDKSKPLIQLLNTQLINCLLFMICNLESLWELFINLFSISLLATKINLPHLLVKIIRPVLEEVGPSPIFSG